MADTFQTRISHCLVVKVENLRKAGTFREQTCQNSVRGMRHERWSGTFGHLAAKLYSASSVQRMATAEFMGNSMKTGFLLLIGLTGTGLDQEIIPLNQPAPAAFLSPMATNTLTFGP